MWLYAIDIVAFFLSLTLLLGFVLADSNNYVPISVPISSYSKECLYFDLESDKDAIVISYQVLTGGNFKIDFEIVAPDGITIVSEKQKIYSEFILRSFGLGTYTFCFNNEYGSIEKIVETVLELEKIGVHTNSISDTRDAVSVDAIEEIDISLNKIMKKMTYLRAREWRNMSTVKSTESRIAWLSILVIIVICSISILQEFAIYYIFQSRIKTYV